MTKKLFAIALAMVALYQQLKAQTPDTETWTSLGVSKKINKKWNIGAEAELRNGNFYGLIDRASLQLEANYNFNKYLKFSASYQAMEYYDFKYSDYQFRNRFSLGATGKFKISRFTVSLRERAQLTTKDESDRIKASGKIDTYKMNPEWMWRNRVKLDYNIRKSKFTPSFSVETFYQLNNPDGNQMDKLRYILSVEYKISKKKSIEVYGLYSKEVNVTSPEKLKVFGLSYNINF